MKIEFLKLSSPVFFYFDYFDLNYIFCSIDLTALKERGEVYSQRTFSSLLGKSKNVQRNCLGRTHKLFCVSGWSSFKLIYWIEMSAALCSFQFKKVFPVNLSLKSNLSTTILCVWNLLHMLMLVKSWLYICDNQIRYLEIETKCLYKLIAFIKRMLRLPPKSLKSRKVCLGLIGKRCSIIKSVCFH